MFSYLEGALCLLSVYLLWYKFRWGNMELMKGFRLMLKKLEAVLTHSSTAAVFVSGRTTQNGGGRSVGSNSKWDSLMGATLTRGHFTARTKRGSGATEGLAKEDLAFYKTMSSGGGQCSLEGRNSYFTCAACQHLTDKDPEGPEDKTGVWNCFDIDTNEPSKPWYIRKMSSFLFFWRKAFLGDEYRMVELKKLMADEHINEAIEECARLELKDNPKAGSLDSLIRKHRDRAERVLIKMRAKQAAKPWFGRYVRIAAWIIGKTLALIYPKILVEKSQVEQIRKAKATGCPIIYLPVHRSHVDYVLVSWSLVCSDMRAPLVAAGENLNIPVFSLMMKSVGGFFIKRRLDRKEGQKDILYRAILQSYMEISLVDDNDMEFFIEGGRTRTGKPCHPKGGLLNCVIDTLMSKKVDDVYIVPVNFSYEKLLEGNYIREQLGKNKVQESFFTAALGLWNSVYGKKFGNARVDYGKPFSAREFIQSYQDMKSPARHLRGSSQESSDSEKEITQSRRSSMQSQSSSIFGSEIPLDQRDLVNNLANHVIYNGVTQFTLMSTSAIAFILLNKYRNGVAMDTFLNEMEILREELVKRKYSVFYDGDVREVVEHGLKVLGPTLVRKELVKTGNPAQPTQVMLKPVTSLPNVIDLSYYSTCVLPIYAMESVIATAILSLTKESQAESGMDIVLPERKLLATCLELCGIVQNEFIFHPPCTTLKDTIRKSFEFLQSEGVLTLRLGSPLEDSEDEDGLIIEPSMVLVSQSQWSRERLVYLKNLTKPLLDTYAVSCHTLKRLIGCEALEKPLQMDMLTEVKSHIQQHNITYGESVALDPIRNFIKLLVSWQVLEFSRRDGVSTYYLQQHFDNEEAVQEVFQRIHRFHL